jgi:hypothetical protein
MLCPVRADHDAELYLRMTVERALLDHEHGGRPTSPVWSAAAAMLAVGAISDESAEQIVYDYDLACFLRNRGGGAFVHRRAAASRGAAPPRRSGAARRPDRPPRALNCNLDLDAPWGRVKVPYVVLSDTFTKVAVETSDPSSQGRGGIAGSLSQIQLSDDRGSSSPAQFQGMGTPQGYTGILTTEKPLHRDTGWIAAGPLRVELPHGDGVSVSVRVEDLPEMDPAVRHLWSTIVDTRRPMPAGGDLEAAIAALAAVGAIDPDSEEVNQIREVAGAVRGPWLPRPRLQPHTSHSGRGLPEPWSSLVSTRRRSAPGGQGTTAVGAVTPPVDGRTVVIVAGLQCHADSFGIPRDDGPLAWWADDDRGGVYLGGPTNWGGNQDSAGGTVMFSPGIDPKCRRLRILPTGSEQRAVIDVPLPWSAER